MPILPPPSHTESSSRGLDPLQRLSKAVKELNRLISRAKHLGGLTEQPISDPEVSSNLTKFHVTSSDREEIARQRPLRPNEFSEFTEVLHWAFSDCQKSGNEDTMYF